MINEKHAKKFCCEDISRIENYEQAINDNTQTWEIHHRREISENKSMKELIAECRYYKVKAEELIFLTSFDHKSLHFTGRVLTTEHKRKLSASVKHTLNDPTIKQKMHDAKVGRHWYTNGINSKLVSECPGNGWYLGRTVYKKD